MASIRDYKPLKMVAQDVDDLNVMSASLQDCVAKIGNFAWIPEQRRFAFVTNRFVWECSPSGTRGPFVRVRTGVHFDDVLSVQSSNLRLEAKAAVVELLSLRYIAGADETGEILMDFAGGGAVRLVVECINASLSDISDPWRTRNKPQHEQ